MSGVFQAEVRGVSYRTASRSGQTDANGMFTYLPGETVEFSVGGVEMGSTKGTSRISLFALAGASPTVNERVLRRELTRLRTTSTPLSRAANLALFLLALDADGSPDNGIDVTPNVAALANSRLDFDVSIYAFRDRLKDLAPGLNNNIPTGQPVIWLYRSFGLRVPGHALAQQTQDYGHDGVVESESHLGYDAAGELASKIVFENGIRYALMEYTRDPLGRPVRIRSEQGPEAGNPNAQYLWTRTYDVHGNEISYVESLDSNADGTPDRQEAAITTFDTFGRELMLRHGADFELDGEIDVASTYTFTRDEYGNLLEWLWERNLVAHEVRRSTFDESNRILTESREIIRLGGRVETRRATRWTYDAAGRVVTIDTRYTDGDNTYSLVLHETRDYDPEGNLRRSTNVSNSSDPFAVDYSLDTQYTYDRDRRVLTIATLFDAAQFVSDFQTLETRTYDVDGFQMSSEIENADQPGAAIGRRTVYVRSKEGAPLSIVTQQDGEGDGIYESSDSFAYEYEQMSDALAQIVKEELRSDAEI